MHLFYDSRDDSLFEKRGMRNLYWLDDLGAKPLGEAGELDQGFLFAGARSIADYQKLVANFPLIDDRPDSRMPLLRLESILERLDQQSVSVPRPRTWQLEIDSKIPPDIRYPLFVRTGLSSWKLGGKISKVSNVVELEAEASALRRVFGWDELILAREWLDIETAGQTIYGPVPVEVRTWIIDQVPFAWSFHHVHAVPDPKGFPLNGAELDTIRGFAGSVGAAFTSRLVCADFVRLESGEWCFLEAGPGSCAGTGHEQVFKSVASKLKGCEYSFQADHFGGRF